jgi:RNA polymerase primary sigma factor
MGEDISPQNLSRSRPIAAGEPAWTSSEHALVARVVAGEAAAATEFLQVAVPPLLAAVAKIEPDDAERREAVRYVLAALRADRYGRLRAFSGRSSLAKFLALTARELLAQRAAANLLRCPNLGWVQFTRIFDADIRARIAARFSHDAGSSRWDDVYQDVCKKLIEDDYRRLRAYGAEGNFIGFVLTIVDRLLIDLMRQEAPRRRLPAAIKQLPLLEREIYIAIAWKGCEADVERLTEFLRGRLDRDPEAPVVREALARVLEFVVLPPRERSDRPTTVSLDAILSAAAEVILAGSTLTPEDELLIAEEEQERNALITFVRDSAEALRTDEKLYLQVAFETSEPLPRRKIAQIMGCSVEEVDRLKQRTQRWLAGVRRAFEKNRECPSLVK